MARTPSHRPRKLPTAVCRGGEVVYVAECDKDADALRQLDYPVVVRREPQEIALELRKNAEALEALEVTERSKRLDAADPSADAL